MENQQGVGSSRAADAGGPSDGPPESGQRPETIATSDRVLRLLLSLLLFAVVGATIWIIYAFASGSFTFLGNCGGQGFIGDNGHWAGGSASSAWTAAVIGGVLSLAAGAVVWRRQETAPVLLAFTGVYVATLIVVGLGVSRLIWGPRHCVLY
jgi:hypothetical protein